MGGWAAAVSSQTFALGPAGSFHISDIGGVTSY